MGAILSGRSGSSSDYTVLVTTCVLLFIYMIYTSIVYCYFVWRFVISMRQHRIVIRGRYNVTVYFIQYICVM